MSTRLVLSTALLFLVAGCLTTRSASAARVRYFINDGFRVQGCEPLGLVTGYSSWGGRSAAGIGAANARIEMLEKAAALGATDLNVLSQDSGFHGTTSEGEAFRCPRAPTPSTTTGTDVSI